MRFLRITVLLVSLGLIVWTTFAFAAPASQGFVQYRVSLNANSSQVVSFLLNETVQPTNQNGIVKLTLEVMPPSRNFTYSRVVNSSSLPEIFPYFVGLNNQSLTYNTLGFALAIHILNTGNTAINFNGKSYQATSYKVSVSTGNATILGPISGSGNIVVMPSGLIYSAQVDLTHSTSLNLQLVATSLSLADTSVGSLPLGVALLGVGLVAAAAFAAPAIFGIMRGRHRRESGTQPPREKEAPAESKPSYWVD
jgi:hypothetical protein